MNVQPLRRSIALLLLLSAGLVVSESNGQMLGSLFQMAGGMDTVKKLAGQLLQSSASDPRLAALLGKANMGSLTPKLADQMCSILGGGCKAPLTDQQIAAGASKLDASQTKALGDNFSSSLAAVTDNPLVTEGLSKEIAPKLGGIIGALL